MLTVPISHPCVACRAPGRVAVVCRVVWYQAPGWHDRPAYSAPPNPVLDDYAVAETVESAWGEWSSAGLISWHGFRAQPTQTHGTAVESGNQQRQHSHSFCLMPFLFTLCVSPCHPPFYLSSLFSFAHLAFYFVSLLSLNLLFHSSNF